MEDGVVEFSNGDASCAHYTKDGHYEVYITKCGESFSYSYGNFGEAARELRELWRFDDEMVEELKRKTVEWDGEID